jgi:hypothetical protein
MLPRARTVSEVPNGTSQRFPGKASRIRSHLCHPDTMTRGHQISASAAIPPPSSRASGRRSRSALVRAASWPAWSSLSGSDSTCGQPPLTAPRAVRVGDRRMRPRGHHRTCLPNPAKDQWRGARPAGRGSVPPEASEATMDRRRQWHPRQLLIDRIDRDLCRPLLRLPWTYT